MASVSEYFVSDDVLLKLVRESAGKYAFETTSDGQTRLRLTNFTGDFLISGTSKCVRSHGGARRRTEQLQHGLPSKTLPDAYLASPPRFSDLRLHPRSGQE